MTNRQSNIIFYSIISIIVYALIIHFTNPSFFEQFTKTKEELSIKEAMDKGDHNKALTLYQQLVEERMSDDDENTAETAALYEDMANLYFLLGNKVEEKNHYLKSLDVKNKLKKVNAYAFADTYFSLGSLAEKDKQYDQAQMYYEKSLLKRVGNTKEGENEGMFVGLQNTRERYLRLNNEETIAILKKLGAIHTIKKEVAIAKKYYERALAVSKEISEEGDLKTLEITNLINRLTL